jgi:hypothetical protein
MEVVADAGAAAQLARQTGGGIGLDQLAEKSAAGG